MATKLEAVHNLVWVAAQTYHEGDTLEQHIDECLAYPIQEYADIAHEIYEEDVVTGIEFLTDELQRKYGNYFHRERKQRYHQCVSGVLERLREI